MFIALTSAGLVEGFLWKGLAPWEVSLQSVRLIWLFRTATGMLMFAGCLTSSRRSPWRSQPMDFQPWAAIQTSYGSKRTRPFSSSLNQNSPTPGASRA
jgi:hypothetical protein